MESFIILPYLTTSQPILIGECLFKNCNDIDDLDKNKQSYLKKIRKIIYLQDKLRINSFAYSVLPITDNARNLPDIEYLQKVKNILGYIYSSPQKPGNDVFMTSEYSSILIFVPEIVDYFLVFSNSKVINESKEKFDKLNRKKGFMLVRNFDDTSWITEQTKVYPANKRIFLNHYQDLNHDIEMLSSDMRNAYVYLVKLLKIKNSISERVFISLKWYNYATEDIDDINYSIICLSIAFESLLNLPADEKTSRIIDSISLLLGRPNRLEEWTRQFYNIRSAIVHEGNSTEHYFTIPGNKKDQKKLYGSVFNNGLVIYRLCLRTILIGQDLSNEFGVDELFISNQERLENIIKICENEGIEYCEKINKVCIFISDIEENAYIPENNIAYSLIFSTLDKFLTLIKNDNTFEDSFKSLINKYLAISSKDQQLPKLDSLNELFETYKKNKTSEKNELQKAAEQIINYTWRAMFDMYMFLKRKV